MSTFLWIVLIGIGLTLLLFIADRDGFWSRMFGPPDLGDVEFAALTKGDRSNEALACPAGKCPLYEGAIETRTYNASADVLLQSLDDALEPDKRVEQVDIGSSPLKRRYVTRSPLMRYPDTVSVEAFEVGDGKSQIAMFARAQIGYCDMGANRSRIKGWLEFLEQAESKR